MQLLEVAHNAILRPALPVIRTMVPRPLLWRAYRRYAKHRYLNFLTAELSEAWVDRTVEEGPAMTERLRLLTRSLDEKSYRAEFTDDQYFYAAYRQAYHFFRLLARNGFNLRTCGAILEFGCGSAPLLRVYRYLDGVRLIGVDANPECIEWCRRNVPDCEFYVNDLTPPLPFPEGSQFDLIVACSVFTHIPLEQQKIWVEEVKRVLKPGGYFVCTLVGNDLVEAQLGAEWRQILKQRKQFQIDGGDSRASLSTRAGGSHYDIFQRRDQVLEVFGSIMRVRDYVPYSRAPIGQDVLLLQRQ